MRMLFVALIALVLMNTTASAQVTVQNMHTIDRVGGVSSQVNVYTTKQIRENMEVYTWSLVSENWSETYVGYNINPKSWLSVGAAFGIETSPGLWRGAAQVWMGNDFGSILTIGEYGDSGGWYLIEGNHPVLNGKAGIGFRAQRFVGVGPRFELKLNETLSIWTVPAAWDFEVDTRNSLITLRYKP